MPAKDRPEGYDLWLDRSGPAWQAVPPLALPAPGATSHNDPLRGARRQRIEAAMRATAEARLPEHMRPAHYVFLDTLPVSPSGKMLAQNLPGPDVAPDAPPGARPHRTIPPRTATELALWRAFTSVLRPADLSVSSGDPSKAARVLGWRASMMMDDVVAAMVAAERGQGAAL